MSNCPISQFVNEYKKLPISDSEIVNLVHGKAKVVLYEDMHKFNTINELFGDKDAIFLMYQQAPNYGHWVALFKRKNNEIEFYDPYGYFIDDQLDWTPKHMRKPLHHDYRYLTKLLKDASNTHKIIYNEYPFQKEGAGISTCGRWSALRVLFKDMPLTQFVKYFDFKAPDNDDKVTLLTMLGI